MPEDNSKFVLPGCVAALLIGLVWLVIRRLWFGEWW